MKNNFKDALSLNLLIFLRQQIGGKSSPRHGAPDAPDAGRVYKEMHRYMDRKRRHG